MLLAEWWLCHPSIAHILVTPTRASFGPIYPMSQKYTSNVHVLTRSIGVVTVFGILAPTSCPLRKYAPASSFFHLLNPLAPPQLCSSYPRCQERRLAWQSRCNMKPSEVFPSHVPALSVLRSPLPLFLSLFKLTQRTT